MCVVGVCVCCGKSDGIGCVGCSSVNGARPDRAMNPSQALFLFCSHALARTVAQGRARRREQQGANRRARGH